MTVSTKQGNDFPHRVYPSFVESLNDVLEVVYIYEELTIPQIAQKLNIGVAKLNRDVKKHLKTTPQLYLRKFRLKKAYLLLGYPEVRISEIGFDCGFKSQSYFSRAFRAEYEECPNKIRKKIIEEK